MCTCIVYIYMYMYKGTGSKSRVQCENSDCNLLSYLIELLSLAGKKDILRHQQQHSNSGAVCKETDRCWFSCWMCKRIKYWKTTNTNVQHFVKTLLNVFLFLSFIYLFLIYSFSWKYYWLCAKCIMYWENLWIAV